MRSKLRSKSAVLSIFQFRGQFRGQTQIALRKAKLRSILCRLIWLGDSPEAAVYSSFAAVHSSFDCVSSDVKPYRNLMISPIAQPKCGFLAASIHRSAAGIAVNLIEEFWRLPGQKLAETAAVELFFLHAIPILSKQRDRRFQRISVHSVSSKELPALSGADLTKSACIIFEYQIFLKLRSISKISCFMFKL